MKAFYSRYLKKLLSLSFVMLPLSLMAQDFDEILVPGAKCQDGSDYKYFIRRGSSQKLLLHLDGGGACWNQSTCTGLIPYSVRKVGEPYRQGIFSQGNKDNPVDDYTFVQIPYCTGDIFIGHHTAKYGWSTVYHWGRSNLEKVLASLKENGIDVNQVSDYIVHGSSAGALGVLLNFQLLSQVVPHEAHKTLVSDAPGLHFGKGVWDRFSEAYFDNIQEAFDRNGLHFPEGEETQVSVLKELCQNHPDWTIATLLGQKDSVMSFFGNMSKSKHQKLVLSENGIWEKLRDPNDNCSSWNPDSKVHTFLENDDEMQITGTDGVSALEFFKQALRGSDDRQYSYQ